MALIDVLKDAAKYPDTTEVTLSSGDKTTVGELRSQLGLKSEFTRETQRLAEEKRQLESQHGQQVAYLQQQMQALNAELTRRGQAPVGNVDDLDRYRGDEMFGPVVRRLDQQAKLLESKMKELDEHKTRLDQHEQAFWLTQHTNVLNSIKSRDPEFQDRAKVNDLLEFAKTHNLNNLDLAHQLFTRDRDLAKAKTDAEKVGYDKGKAETSSPHVPSGTTNGANQTSKGTGTWEVPKDDSDTYSIFNKAEQAALNDNLDDLEKAGAAWSNAFQGKTA